jgi:MATE family multidrug resistance protein
VTPAVREVWSIAWPTVVTMLSYTLMQFVDAVMVAQVGPVEVAAQGNGGVWTWALVVMLIGVLSLVNTYVSQAVGAGRPHEVARYAWAGVWLAAIAWVAVLLPASFAMPVVFRLMGHGERLTALETSYAQVLLWGGIAVTLGKAMSNVFFGIQRPRVITAAAIAGNAVNLVLNYVLIFGRDGLPSLGLPGIPGLDPMGVTGAAIATVAGTAVETAIPLAVFLGRRMDAEFGIRRAWRFDRDAVRDLVRLGTPAALQSGSELVTWAIFMTVLVGQFGEVALAAGWATLRYMHISFMPAYGFGIAVTSLVGKHIGAGRPDLAVDRARIGLFLAVGYMALCGGAILAFREPMLAVFARGQNTPPEVADAVVSIGMSLMVAAALFQVFDAVGIVFASALRGAGDTFWPGVLTVALSWGLIVGGGWALVRLAPGLGALGPWIAASAYITVLGVVLALRWQRGAWRAIRVLETPDQEAARIAAEHADGQR